MSYKYITFLLFALIAIFPCDNRGATRVDLPAQIRVAEMLEVLGVLTQENNYMNVGGIGVLLNGTIIIGKFK